MSCGIFSKVFCYQDEKNARFFCDKVKKMEGNVITQKHQCSVQHVGSVNGAKFSSYLVFVERIFFCYTGIIIIFSHVCKGLSQVINSDVFLQVVVHFVAD